MRHSVKILLAVVVVLVVAVIAAPFLVPMDAYRGPIEQAASNATQREVRIVGPLRLTLYPEIGVEAADVSMSNAEGARDPQMVAIDSLVVGVRFWPLLSGRVEVARLILEQPSINLEIAADGTPNFGFPGAENAGAPAPAADGTAASDMAAAIGVDELRISDGKVTYYNAETGADIALQDVDIALEMPSANQPMIVDGALTYNEQRLELAIRIEEPIAVLEPNGTAATISLASDLLVASFEGNLAPAGRTAGALSFEAPVLRQLANWSGHPLPPGDNFRTASLQTNLAAENDSLALNDLQMTLDGMTISGEMTLDNTGATPNLVGQLALDRLNLNDLLAAAPAAAQDVPPQGPRTAPLQLDLLKLANADLTLTIGQLLIQNMTLERVTLGARLTDGLLNADLRELALYGGSGRGNLTIDARNAVPTFRQSLQVSNTQILPPLNDLMAIDRIDGTAALNLDLSSRGTNEQEIMSALSGTANVNLANGAIRGVDLAAVARLLENVLNNQGLGAVTGGDTTTEFTEAGGSFTVRNGVAHSDDFRLVSPVLRIDGTGDIDLARRSIDFRLQPRPTAGGTVGQVNLAQIGVPFRIQGPWADLSYGPDLENIDAAVIENLVGGLLGQMGQGTQDGQAEQPRIDPAEALRSLFGR